MEPKAFPMTINVGAEFLNALQETICKSDEALVLELNESALSLRNSIQQLT